MPRRKASYSSDEDEESDNRQRKRQRLESADVEERLESLIVRAGSKSALDHIESNLEGLATVLESDLASYKEKILNILLECVIAKPESLSVYATLVALLNVKNYSCGGEFIELLVRRLKESLKTCTFGVAQNIIRFISDLVNCRVVNVTSVLAMFDDFVEVTLEDDIPQVRSDWYVFVVLSSLPWVGRVLTEAKTNEFRRLLSTIENYLRKRKKKHVSALRVWESSEIVAQEDYLDCLWAQIGSLQQQNWIDQVTFRPYLSFESLLEDAMTHSLPQIVAPPHQEDSIYPPPRVIFRLFDNTDVPEGGAQLPSSHSIERFLIDDYLSLVVNTYSVNRKECCQNLVNFRSRKPIPLNYMIVEIVFGQLFCLPQSKELEVFYGVLLIELSRQCPDTMPLVLAQATEMLFERLDTMQSICIERFTRWFSYHLSNFKYQWNWSDWASALAEDLDTPRPKFISEVLHLLMEFSYYQNVVTFVPSEFTVLIPPATGSIFKYADADKLENDGEGDTDISDQFQMAATVAHRLMSVLKSKCTPEEAGVKLKQLPAIDDIDDDDIKSEDDIDDADLNAFTMEDEDDDESDSGKDDEEFDRPRPKSTRERRRQYRENRLKVDVFFTCLFNLGNKSLSHTFALLDKYQVLAVALVDGNLPLQIEVLRILREVWQHQPQMIKVIHEQLLRLRIISFKSVVVWIFSPDMSDELTKFYVADILNGLMRRLGKRSYMFAADAEDKRNDWELLQEKLRDGFEIEPGDRWSEVPDEDQLLRLERKVKNARREQREIILLIFRELSDILTHHLTQCAAESRSYDTTWYKWILDRLHQLFMQHHNELQMFTEALETEIFTSDLDANILRVYHQFLSLRA